jgi:hypothetical protein
MNEIKYIANEVIYNILIFNYLFVLETEKARTNTLCNYYCINENNGLFLNNHPISQYAQEILE